MVYWPLLWGFGLWILYGAHPRPQGPFEAISRHREHQKQVCSINCIQFNPPRPPRAFPIPFLMHFIMLIIIHIIRLFISSSDQEKFKILSFVTRKTVGTMRIVAKFRAGWWYREDEGLFLSPFRDHSVTIFVFHTFPGSARTKFVKTARCHTQKSNQLKVISGLCEVI